MSLFDPVPQPQPPQAQMQPSMGQRFQSNMGPILQALGIGQALHVDLFERGASTLGQQLAVEAAISEEFHPWKLIA